MDRSPKTDPAASRIAPEGRSQEATPQSLDEPTASTKHKMARPSAQKNTRRPIRADG